MVVTIVWGTVPSMVLSPYFAALCLWLYTLLLFRWGIWSANYKTFGKQPQNKLLFAYSLSQEVTHSRMPTLSKHPLYQSINQSINQTINPLFSIITVCLPIYTGHKVYLCKCIIFIYHQRNQAGSSPAMEFMGFKACMDYLTGCGLLLKAFVSDRHVSIAAYMRKSLPNITHYFSDHCSSVLLLSTGKIHALSMSAGTLKYNLRCKQKTW